MKLPCCDDITSPARPVFLDARAYLSTSSPTALSAFAYAAPLPSTISGALALRMSCAALLRTPSSAPGLGASPGPCNLAAFWRPSDLVRIRSAGKSTKEGPGFPK